jgi:hypothetical protein
MRKLRIEETCSGSCANARITYDTGQRADGRSRAQLPAFVGVCTTLLADMVMSSGMVMSPVCFSVSATLIVADMAGMTLS